MKVDPGCFPCALRRLLSTAARITDDPWLAHKLLGKAMTELAEVGRDDTPAEMMHGVEKLLLKTLGTTDPYLKEREAWDKELEGISEKARARVGTATDPLELALLLAARANVFDDECLASRDVRDELRRLDLREGGTTSEAFATSDLDLFVKDLDKSESLLFLHDSGPELPFDGIVIERIHERWPDIAITLVVRSAPVLLDATADDIATHGLGSLAGVAEVIDPGISALGIPLNECTREFRDRFKSADVVLGKGQAHYETLADGDKTTYFLMRVKCDVMAKHQGVSVGDLVFIKG